MAEPLHVFGRTQQLNSIHENSSIVLDILKLRLFEYKAVHFVIVGFQFFTGTGQVSAWRDYP